MSEALVYYGATEDGYQVSAVDGGNLLDHYRAGNNPYDSHQPCPPDVQRVSTRTLWKWARESALEMAEAHGIPRFRVVKDEN